MFCSFFCCQLIIYAYFIADHPLKSAVKQNYWEIIFKSYIKVPVIPVIWVTLDKEIISPSTLPFIKVLMLSDSFSLESLDKQIIIL